MKKVPLQCHRILLPATLATTLQESTKEEPRRLRVRTVEEAAEASYLIADITFTTAMTLADYYWNRRDDLTRAHERSATRLLHCAQRQKALVCKFGQHISALHHAVPPEYHRILSALTDKQPSSSPKRIQRVLQEEGLVLEDFDATPVASASIAQVHKASYEGQPVAVKIMHPGLENKVAANMKALRFGFWAAKFVFPSVAEDWKWLLPEFEDAIALELDLVQEAANCERAKALLKDVRGVDVPKVVWPLTSRRVLVTEFIEDAHRVDDIDAHRENGIPPVDVARALVGAVSTLAYEHGLIHADPHGGNALVTKDGTLYLLDHGLYRRLDATTLRDIDHLWEALAKRDFATAATAAHNLNLGGGSKEDALAVARLLFTASAPSTTSSSSSSRPLGAELDAATRAALVAEVRRRLPNGARDVADLLRSVNRDLLFMLRASSLLRGQHASLGGKRRDRYIAFAIAAARGLCVPLIDDDDPTFGLPQAVTAVLSDDGGVPRVQRPGHPLNRPTPSERARARRRLSWLRTIVFHLKVALRLAGLLTRIAIVDASIILRRRLESLALRRRFETR